MIVLRTIGRLVSPGGARGRLSVLIFHRVRAHVDPVVPQALDAAQFDRILDWVAQSFNVLGPDEAVERLRSGTLPARALAITFDDGYADNAEVALPILQRHRMRAGFFIATDFLDGGAMWNDAIGAAVRACTLSRLDLCDLGLGEHPLSSPASRRQALATILPAVKYHAPPQRQAVVAEIVARTRVPALPQLMMRSEQVRALHSAGMAIGGHTCSHPILASLSLAEAEREIVHGKQRLEDILGAPIHLFAYPNGKPGQDYTAEHARLVEAAGFKAAFSTGWGVSRSGSDLFQLPRFTPWDRDHRGFMLRLVRNMLRSRVALA